MDQQNPTNWQQMFEAKRRDRPPEAEHLFGGYDDGFAPTQRQADGEMLRAPLSLEDITDEAAMALALDAPEYKPWVLQRGRGRPAMMLHLRRYEPKSGLWCGWQIAYPHLIAVEYTGDKMLSLDFGTRQFIIEGTGLRELTKHLQLGNVLMVQEYCGNVWPSSETGPTITSIGQLERQRITASIADKT